MHRTIEITVSATATQSLCHELERLEHVVGLSIQRGTSVKPPGDVITVHVLNRGADDVLRCASTAQRHGSVSIVTSEIASIIDPAYSSTIRNDVDEAIWEEIETNLYHQGQVTPNFFALMALGGVISAVALVSEGTSQAVAFVACSVIAPGFEPLAKIPLGFVLRRWQVVKHGVMSTALGYAVLIAGAAGSFFILNQIGAVSIEQLITNPEVEGIAHPKLLDYLVSLCAAAAGMVMIAAYRRSVIAGPLIALVLIQAAALVGAAISVGQLTLAFEGLERFCIDMLVIIAVGALVFLIKQATVHRRSPIA